jgi:hypothetical protein
MQNTFDMNGSLWVSLKLPQIPDSDWEIVAIREETSTKNECTFSVTGLHSQTLEIFGPEKILADSEIEAIEMVVAYLADAMPMETVQVTYLLRHGMPDHLPQPRHHESTAAASHTFD